MPQRAADLEMTVGDRRPSFVVELREYPGGDLVTLTAPTLKLVHAATNAVKVNYAAMSIVSPGVARYDWATNDVDAAGDYYLWIRDTDSGGLTWHWPYGGRRYLVRFTAAA